MKKYRLQRFVIDGPQGDMSAVILFWPWLVALLAEFFIVQPINWILEELEAL